MLISMWKICMPCKVEVVNVRREKTKKKKKKKKK